MRSLTATLTSRTSTEVLDCGRVVIRRQLANLRSKLKLGGG